MFKNLFLVIAVCITAIVADNIDQNAETLNFASEINPDGSYEFKYETSNGISGQESGVGGVSAQGEAKWIAQDGTPIQLTYVADENGFQPKGDHLPVGPPAPPHIAKLIEWLESHPSDDDGSYKPKN